jgi:hypothetical protein
MKWLSYLLLLYLALIVSAHMHVCDHEDEASHTEEHQNQSEPCCPPFSWCKTCSHFVNTPSIIFIEPSEITYKQENPFFHPFFIESIKVDFIWQPPQMAA